MPLEKRALRKSVRERLAALGAVERDLSIAAQDRLLASGLLDSRRCVALYRALPAELSTDLLESTLRWRGVRVLLPRVRKDQRELELCDANGTFLRGPLGIDEPHPDQQAVALDLIDAFVIPGLAFDEHGARLGHGRAHYDATLAANPAALRIGFFRDQSGVDEVPSEPHDQRLDFVITPSRIIECPPRTKAR